MRKKLQRLKQKVIGFGRCIMLNGNLIKQIKDYAELNNVPIMTDDGMNYVMDYIRKSHVKKILEIGSAIGYSAIMMCSVDPNITVTTIERDEKRYLEALKNIKKLELEDRINLIYKNKKQIFNLFRSPLISNIFFMQFG